MAGFCDSLLLFALLHHDNSKNTEGSYLFFEGMENITPMHLDSVK